MSPARRRARKTARARRPKLTGGRGNPAGPKIPGAVMRELRAVALGECTQARAASLLGCGERTIWKWEKDGSFARDGYAYVGLAFRVGYADRAAAALNVLAEVDAIEGVAVAVASLRQGGAVPASAARIAGRLGGLKKERPQREPRPSRVRRRTVEARPKDATTRLEYARGSKMAQVLT